MNGSAAVIRLSLSGACLLLAACQTELTAPAYETGFERVVDAEGRSLLIPKACRRYDGDGQLVPEEDVLALPLGCANNANLLRMVERRGDVLRGRETGPTLAAPVGRAAQSYLEGFETEEKRRRRQEQAAQNAISGGAR
jgi:hypothetical protein